MFRLLGEAITRFWPISLVAWVVVLIITALLAPPWQSITKDSDVAFLPEQSPSSRGDLLFQESFPDQRSGSSIVLVVARATDKLSDEDQAFVTDTLAPELVKLGKEHADLFRKVRTMADGSGGALLVSPDRHATVVIVDLAAAFLEPKSYPLVKDVEALVQRLEKEAKVPSGLDIHLTGSATAGRDLAQAQAQSVHAIERWTIVVVVVLLILLYRAPLLALIPLATVYVGVQISFNLLAMMGEANILTLSGDVRIFVTVLAYGAGVDYCLFLISRYREELLTGIEPRQAMADAITRVGTAVSASAATVICGIGVLAFMQFGKIREAGIVIPFALFIVLCGTLTFTTALLRLAGRWAFWPHRRPAPHEPKTLAPSLLHRLAGIDIWKEVGSWMLRWPGAIWMGTVAIMVPFAAYALVHYEDETYNPIGDLPKDAQSVAGSNVLEKYFPPGILGPTSVFIINNDVDFGSIKGTNIIAQVTDHLAKHRQELDLADIRSVAKPLGVTPAGEEADSASGLGRSVRRARAAHFYVSRTADWKGHLTRLDLVLTKNPFSVEAVDALNRIQQELQASLPDALKGSEVVTAGATITIRASRPGEVRRLAACRNLRSPGYLRAPLARLAPGGHLHLPGAQCAVELFGHHGDNVPGVLGHLPQRIRRPGLEGAHLPFHDTCCGGRRLQHLFNNAHQGGTRGPRRPGGRAIGTQADRARYLELRVYHGGNLRVAIFRLPPGDERIGVRPQFWHPA